MESRFQVEVPVGPILTPRSIPLLFKMDVSYGSNIYYKILFFPCRMHKLYIYILVCFKGMI